MRQHGTRGSRASTSGRVPRLTAIGAVVAATAATAMVSVAIPAAAAGEIQGAGVAGAIPDSYLVQLRDDVVSAANVSATAGSIAVRYGGQVGHTYRHALRGFAVTMPAAAARRLAADPAVARVVQNAEVRAVGTQPNPPSWGLDRVDQRDLPLNAGYTYPNTAPNVTAYIIDTGIRTTHVDFGGRAVWGTNTTGDGNDTDCNGHGTHVAGTVGGVSYGVAKSVSLVAVKVLNCGGSGTWEGVAAGIDWVTGQHAAGAPAVANMSLGGAANALVDTAVRNSIADGVTYAVAAGNSNADACGFSPARVAEAITVNASDIGDNRAGFSNYGTCTDIFAPGVNITSAWSTGDNATNTISGTSMASPHVAGGAALILSGTPSATPAQVASTMLAAATPNKIVNPGPGSPNRLLFVGGSTPPPTLVMLTRYYYPGRDHLSTTGTAGPGYQLEGHLGRLNTSAVAGTHPLYLCRAGAYDTFTSRASNCEGQVVLGLLGHAYSSPPAIPNAPVYRCIIPSNGEHFDSPAANCEGQISEGVLGYLV